MSKRKYCRWSKAEVDYIRWNMKKMGICVIASELERSPWGVKAKAVRMRIKKLKW